MYTTINKSSDYFSTKLYTGNGTDATGITGLGFEPSLVWIKERSSTSPHKLLDAVRGATKELTSNGNNAEETEATSLQSFDSDGFTVGTNGAVNENSQTYASWNWKANGAGSANTDGSVTATVSANQTSGISIIKLTNPASGSYTVGHGLGVAPDMLIFKSLDGGAQSWFVLHKDLTSYTDRYLRLQDTVAEVTYSMQTQVPTNSLLYLNSGGVGNGNSGLICYAFAEKQGYSKFGSYTGNGSTNFIYTGFKPAWFMCKRTNSSGNFWHIYDNKRSSSGGSNIIDDVLYPNRSDAEYSGDKLDFVSNGITFRSGNGDINGSGGNYIFMCFAEAPLVGTNNVPCTAR